ncbi:MAG: sigma-70 family RNA polymerase sigma factor [Alicyclobacillaceae bacterium]|nr:sigma-70 family RNA polymerase sigma factor [Alicyclobacillaceae bacterium]
MNRIVSSDGERQLTCSESLFQGESWSACEELVRRIAARLKRRLPAHVRLEDLVMAGQEGLWDAARTFDPSRGVPFLQYAKVRIRGAMVDELRRTGIYGRSQQWRRAQAAYGAQAQVAPDMISLDEQGRHEWLVDDTVRTPEEAAVRSGEIAELNAALAKLTQQEQLVLSLVFVEELNLSEVAEVLSLSRSRVSAIYHRALNSLKGSLLRARAR